MMFVCVLVRVIVVMRMAVTVIMIVRMTARFAGLENACDPFEGDRFSFEHLFHREVVLYEDTFVGECGLKV